MSVLIPLLLTLGCVPQTGHPAPADATVNPTPDEYTLTPESAGSIGDGVGYLVKVDAMVQDLNGIPLPDTEVEFTSEYGGMYLLPEAAIREVDQPDGQAEGADCDLESPTYDAEACAWFDIETEYYFELSPTYSGDYRPNYVVSKTDRFGNARMWVYVDAFPTNGDDSYSSVFVSAKITNSFAVITFSPESGA
ncbi:MAG: hypothetical protein ACI9VR_001351 [Cognaticolwellia sp.]|jgi:hypothetical protein